MSQISVATGNIHRRDLGRPIAWNAAEATLARHNPEQDAKLDSQDRILTKRAILKGDRVEMTVQRRAQDFG